MRYKLITNRLVSGVVKKNNKTSVKMFKLSINQHRDLAAFSVILRTNLNQTESKRIPQLTLTKTRTQITSTQRIEPHGAYISSLDTLHLNNDAITH